MKNVKKTLCVLSLGLLASVAVSCGNGGEKEPSIQDTLDAAIAKLVLSQNNTDVVANFPVAAFVKYEGVKYDITWTSSNAAAVVTPLSDTQKAINITRPENGEGDAEVTLTAKISATEAESTYYASKAFNFVVPELEATPATANIAALKAEINTGYTSSSSAYSTNFGDHELTVVGILEGKGVLVADETDVIYVYGSTLTDLKVGDNIKIKECIAYRYYGCPELVDCTYEVVSHGNANPCTAKTDVTVAALTAALEAAAYNANNMDISNFAYFRVTAKVLNVEGKYVVLADPANETDTTKWLVVYNYNTDYKEIEKVAGATVTVDVQLHDVYSNFDFGGETGKHTIFRVNYFGGPVSAELSDEQKAANTLKTATGNIAASYDVASEIALDSSVTWSLNAEADTAVFALTDNKLTLTPGSESKTATLTAKVTLNGVDYTKDVTITVNPSVLTLVTDPAVATAYKLSFITTDNKQLFLTGELDGYYLGADKEAGKVVDFYLEAADTGYYIYATIDGTKTYLSTVASGSYLNPTFVTENPSAWVWDADKDVFINVEGTHFLGGRETYTTGGLYTIDKLENTAEYSTIKPYIYTGEVIEEEQPSGGNQGTGEATTIADALTLSFPGLANKASADDYMEEHFPNWAITGKLGNGYENYLGFGRSGDRESSITSPKFEASEDFSVTAVLKGNGNNGTFTSTVKFEILDENNAVIATGKVVSDDSGANAAGTTAICPMDATDCTIVIEFEYVSGKTFADAAHLKISFSKDTGNIGFKSLSLN